MNESPEDMSASNLAAKANWLDSLGQQSTAPISRRCAKRHRATRTSTISCLEAIERTFDMALKRLRPTEPLPGCPPQVRTSGLVHSRICERPTTTNDNLALKMLLMSTMVRCSCTFVPEVDSFIGKGRTGLLGSAACLPLDPDISLEGYARGL